MKKLRDFTEVVSLIRDLLKGVTFELHLLPITHLVLFFIVFFCNGIYFASTKTFTIFIELIKLCKNLKYFRILFTFFSSTCSFIRRLLLLIVALFSR